LVKLKELIENPALLFTKGVSPDKLLLEL